MKNKLCTAMGFFCLTACLGSFSAEAKTLKLDNEKSKALLTILSNSGAPGFSNDDETGIRIENVWCKESRYATIANVLFEGVDTVTCAFDTTANDVTKAEKKLSQSISLSSLLMKEEVVGADCAMGKCYAGVKSIQCDTDTPDMPSTIGCTIDTFDSPEQ